MLSTIINIIAFYIAIGFVVASMVTIFELFLSKFFEGMPTMKTTGDFTFVWFMWPAIAFVIIFVLFVSYLNKMIQAYVQYLRNIIK